jgi:hypothetical protein
MSQAENKEYYISGTVWNIWADYWTPKNPTVPPLHYLRIGGTEDFVFVSSISVKDLDGFIEAVKATADLRFSRHGDWWLPPWRWFGDWVVFSAEVRQAFMGVERRVWGRGEVIDFDNTGDSRMTPLRSAGEANPEVA